MLIIIEALIAVGFLVSVGASMQAATVVKDGRPY